MENEIVDLISPCVVVGLFAVFVGAVIQWRIAKKQIVASSISSNCQNWIDELRKEVAELLMISSHLKEPRHVPDGLSDEQSDQHLRELIETRNRESLLICQIRLRLNPNEDLHKELIGSLSKMADVSHKNKLGSDEKETAFQEAQEHSVKTAQKILKSEWDRVKRGD